MSPRSCLQLTSCSTRETYSPEAEDGENEYSCSSGWMGAVQSCGASGEYAVANWIMDGERYGETTRADCVFSADETPRAQRCR